MSGERVEELTLDHALSGDRESLVALGVVTAKAIKELGVAVLMKDAVGRIRLMSPEAVQVVREPTLEPAVLNRYSEEEAINIMVAQGNSEEEIIEYLSEREKRNAIESM